MKHKTVVLVTLAVVVALSAASLKAYHHKQYFINVQHRAAAAVQKRQAEFKAAQEQAQLDKLKTQCAKDHTAYLALTPAQKLKTTAPDCNPNLQLVQ